MIVFSQAARDQLLVTARSNPGPPGQEACTWAGNMVSQHGMRLARPRGSGNSDTGRGPLGPHRPQSSASSSTTTTPHHPLSHSGFSSCQPLSHSGFYLRYDLAGKKVMQALCLRVPVQDMNKVALKCAVPGTSLHPNILTSTRIF